jgi:4-amino-4-deoxy-L-arabinose transferase-like glycosyltransferase
MNLFERTIFSILFWTISILTITQVYLIFNSPPNEWDSMTGHLNRILYFLDQGTTEHFIGTNFNVDTYPKSFCSIQVYPFLMSGYNEHFFKLPNFGSFWLICFGTYGILKQLGASYKSRLLGSLIVFLSPNIIMQSILTDTDIVLGAYLVSIIYLILVFKNTQRLIYIYFVGLAFGLALSHKITFAFSFLPLIIIYLFVVFSSSKNKISFKLKHFFCAHLLGIIFFVAPTGYIANYLYYNHPIGPEVATRHQSVERAGSLRNLMVQGSRNVVRYSFDLLNFDGLRNWTIVEEKQMLLKSKLIKIDKHFNLGLEATTDFTIIPFSFNRRFEFYNGSPIYGSIFILLILPSIFFFFKRPNFTKGIFLSAFILHFLILAYSAPYDPWKGRYMISSLIYIVPFFIYIGDYFFYNSPSRFFKLIFVFTIAIISISALSTIGFNLRALPFDAYGKKSILKLNRMEALTVSRPDITLAYLNFDKIVPSNAIVALGTINDDYEYPLWGKDFKRKLIPINPFGKGLQKIPKEAQYLFFASSIIKPLKTDIRLGTQLDMKSGIMVPAEDYYLRKLF